MAGSMEPRPGEGRFDALVRWLGAKDAKTEQFAVTMLCQVGKQAALPLIMEAMSRGKRSKHRVAILDVVQRIGGPLLPEEWLRLRSLFQHRDPAVRRKAAEVIMSMAPGGAPTSDAELAMMRIFNPLLAVPPRRRVRPRRPFSPPVRRRLD